MKTLLKEIENAVRYSIGIKEIKDFFDEFQS